MSFFEMYKVAIFSVLFTRCAAVNAAFSDDVDLVSRGEGAKLTIPLADYFNGTDLQ